MGKDETSEVVISAEDFKAAIAACCEKQEMNEAYCRAPQGARMYLGLIFYQLHFGENADERQIREILADIESELTVYDLNYLLNSPIVNKEEKQYLNALRIEAEKPKEDLNAIAIKRRLEVAEKEREEKKVKEEKIQAIYRHKQFFALCLKGGIVLALIVALIIVVYHNLARRQECIAKKRR